MSDRTFGWVQDSGEIAALKRIAAIFVRDSETHRYLKEYAIPRYVPERCGKKALLDALAQPGELTYEYGMLKGKGDSSTTQLTVRENIEMFGIAESEAQKRVAARGRGNAACSGLIQAVLVAQKKFESTGESKPYQGDWPAECFLRLAVSIGMLDYCAATDTCALSETGKRYYETAEGSLEERNLLISMFLSCPPVVRVLSLLADSDGMTKFEIGSRLGFVGEAGFTTVPQNYFAYACNVIDVDKSVLEGTADKYARMIGGWLVKIKLAEKNKRFYTESYLNREYEVDLEAYRATEEGRRRLRQLAGYSSRGKTSKIVLKEMLATKTPDKKYVRNRRALIIEYLNGSSAKTVDDVCKFLASQGFDETNECVEDDIKGFVNIGLTVIESGSAYRITDKIEKLDVSYQPPKRSSERSDVTLVKERCRSRLKTIDHRYLNLIELSRDGAANREFEIQTIAFLTNELGFRGVRLGESRKPDGVVYERDYGAIIDNKAYKDGYNLPIAQADEMIRYLEENNARDPGLNKTEWWNCFPPEIARFCFVFVSSSFKGEFGKQLAYIRRRTNVPGSAINAENLLYLGESIKSGAMSRRDFFKILACNSEVEIGLTP